MCQIRIENPVASAGEKPELFTGKSNLSEEELEKARARQKNRARFTNAMPVEDVPHSCDIYELSHLISQPIRTST